MNGTVRSAASETEVETADCVKGGEDLAKQYDLLILGGGPGGYVAAVRASQLGLKTAVIEKDKPGGTCLHKGCIPVKALLRSAEVYAQTKAGKTFGVITEKPVLDFKIVQERKRKIVDRLYLGVLQLLKKRDIDVYYGVGRIVESSSISPWPAKVSVETEDGTGEEILSAKYLIISTGSSPRMIPGLEPDGVHILTSDDALEMETLPQSVIIAGGGVIGLEWASLLSDFDVQVTILEKDERLISREDHALSTEIGKLMKKRGIHIFTGAGIRPESLKKGTAITIGADIGGKMRTFAAERLLLAVGRKGNTAGIGLENTEIQVENGFIVTNEFMQTNEPHIYAVGDCIGGMQLAHAAFWEGITAVEHLVGKNPRPIDYTLIPRCIYSRPEAASIGLTEVQARQKGYSVKTGKFPLAANGKALVFGETDGFVKVVADGETNDLLGIHIVGLQATEMISEAGLAKFLDATPWELGRTPHPHPALSEALMEAALDVDGNAVHT